MKSRTKQSLMKRVDDQSSFTTTCKPSDTGTSYQRREGALALCLALCTLGMSLSASAQEPTITTFDPPGSIGTVPININPAGAITGYYFESSATHGFVRARNGTIITFDAPGSAGTIPASINPAGAITGYYAENFVAHGFLRGPLWPDSVSLFSRLSSARNSAAD